MERFPCWRFHRTEPMRLINTPEEEEALGEGWADTPAAFLDPAPEAAPEAPGAEAPAEGKQESKKSRKKKQDKETEQE